MNRFLLTAFLLGFFYASASAQATYTIGAAADAYVRNGSYAAVNYGNDTALLLKGSASSGYTRTAYLKFSLTNSGITNIGSAKLRIYGRNTDNTSSITVSAYGVNTDTWTETGITWNNAPAASATALSSTGVNNQLKYYDLDVSDFVRSQFASDKVVSLLVKDALNQNANLSFNSKENSANKPQLVIQTAISTGNPLLFIDNPDKFPANDVFVFSHIQTPWTRDTLYAANHDSLRIRIYNKGIDPLTVSNLVLSNSSAWKIDKIKGVKYNPATSLPVMLTTGTYAEVIVKFTAVDQATRVKVLHDSLTIVSNDNKFPSKTIYLNGLWQKNGEGANEPYASEIINAFGFKTATGFNQTDPNSGDTTAALTGDEIRPSYFIRADNSRQVSVVQVAAYHSCCNISPAGLYWYPKGKDSLVNIATHILKDGQTVMPRKSSPNTPVNVFFSPKNAFGLRIGSKDNLDAAKNTGGKIGIKVWKAVDAAGNIIPNSYFFANGTNYDYQDNMYFIKNVRPEKGTAYFSTLRAAPSAADFGEKLLQSNNSLTLNISSLGKSYTDGSKDPAVNISAIRITGENKDEFSASLPVKTTLNAQETTTLAVSFNPASQGLKSAELLIYYNNSLSPLRVPLYGIAKSSGTTVVVNYRINSGASTSITINGKKWSADNKYTVGDMQPYTNTKLTDVAGTDEDSLFYTEQHSDSTNKPWSYEFPVANGNYAVRLQFAEIYWGVVGGNPNGGGTGLREMSVATEGQLRLVNFDPTLEAGAATAIVKNFPVTVTDGKLNVNFTSTVDRPMVCAIEVYSFAAAANKPMAQIVENDVSEVKAFPNPVQKTLKLKFTGKDEGDYDLQLADVAGRIYELGKIRLPKGASNIERDISKLGLKQGFYYLRILSKTAKPETIKLIIQ